MAGVAELGVLVERDLAVEGDDVAVLVEDQRVHLDERRVLALVDVVELHEHVGDLVDELGREVRGDRDLAGLRGGDAGDRVDLDARERLGLLDGELLDLHAALDAREREVGAVRAVEEHREVELLRDAGAARDHDALDDVALDVEPEDGLRGLLRLVGVLRDLDAARLAAAARLHLGLDHDDAAELLGRGADRFWGVGDDAREHRDPVLLEQVSGLVLVKIHALLPIGPHARRRTGAGGCGPACPLRTLTLSISRYAGRPPWYSPSSEGPNRADAAGRRMRAGARLAP